MKPEDVPMSERIFPGEKCQLCGETLEIIESANCEEDLEWVGCPNGEGDDGHTEYNGLPSKTLEAWGWEFE